ncbi:MAG: hypothetical protein AB7U73_05705 [Pirellulales bacterium]
MRTESISTGNVENEPLRIASDDPLDAPQSLRQQLRCQARQLANRFAAKQQRLDHREAELHVRLAELENAQRRERLIYCERETNAEAREAHLAERERELADRLSQVAASEAYLEAARRDLSHREDYLVDRANQLEELQHRLWNQNDALAAAAANLEQRRAVTTRQEQLAEQAIVAERETTVTLPARREESSQLEPCEPSSVGGLDADVLAAWEVNLVDAEARLAARERALEPRRLRLAARLRAARRRLHERHQRLHRQLQRQWRDCDRQRMAVRQRYAELESLREVVAREQAELLQVRLAIRQLSADLAGSLPGDAWQQALAEAREAITSHYRRREARLVERECSLKHLQQEIGIAHGQLSLERNRLARHFQQAPELLPPQEAA